jgi:uncharacterized protein (TIGR03067 family)
MPPTNSAEDNVMRICILLVVATIVIGFSPAQEPAKSDLEKFQGSWQAFYVIDMDGKSSPADEVKNTRLVVEGSQFTLRTKDSVIKGTFTINPSQSPKAIDVVLEGQKPGEKLLGIYRIDGDERRSCFVLPGKERSKDIDPKTPGYLQMGWKRQSP